MCSLSFSKTQHNLLGAMIFLIIVKLCFTGSFPQLQQRATGNFYNEVTLKTSQILQGYFKYQLTFPTTNVLGSSDKVTNNMVYELSRFYHFSL